ncbi:MAG: carboxypeptidase regulatory-like domain-containing protein [Terracidiphilus sp.]|jgi:hypothetical protein
MAETRWNGIRCLVLGALCLSAHAVVLAQSGPADSLPPNFVQIQSPQSGSIGGRLTDLHSAPLAGVSIVLRNQATGAEARTTTAKNGAFHFASLDAGEYVLDAGAARLGHGRLDGILVTGGIESRVQAAIHFEPVAPALLDAAAPPQTASSPTVPTSMPPGAILSAASVPPTPLRSPSPSPATVAQNTPPAAPRPAPRPAPTTSSPQLVASIADEPLGRLPLRISTDADAIRPSAQPAVPTPVAPPVKLPPAAPTKSPIIALPSATPAPLAPQHAQPAAHVLALPMRAALETQSAAGELALAAAPPRVFPLKAGSAPSLAATAVPPSLVQAALLNLPPLAAAVAAPQPSDPVAPAVSTTVTATQLQALPASGRRWQQFLLDTPAASASADSSQGSYRGSHQSAEVAIDGANTSLAFGVAAGSATRASSSSGDDTDPQGSMSQSGNRSWSGGRGLGVSEAAIREVTTAAGNVEAEGMRSTGGRTAIRTESGTNALHGQGFLFDRQNTWGARNPFTQWLQNTGSASAPNFTTAPFTPPDHEIVWGLGLGSDIRRNKLFWFAALDSNRRNDPGLSTVRNPAEFFTPPEPTSASVTLLSAQLGESQNQAWNDYLGVAASGYAPAGLEQLAALLGPAPRTSVQWVGFARIDWQAAERHHFTLEGIGADLSAPGGGLTRVSETYGSHSFGSSQASQQWLLARWEAYLTPNLLAVMQGSAGRAILSARPDAPSAFEQSFLGGNSWNQLPQIVVDSRYGFTIGNPSRFGQGSYPDERLFHGQEMLDWVHGKLLVKAGFELDHNSDAVTELRNQTGTYSYSTVASFISDAVAFQKFGLSDALDAMNPHNCGVANTKFGSQPCYSYYSQTMGPTNWHLSTNDFAGYATAQWQLSKLAVLSAGLRWEREQMPPPIASLANPELTSATQTNPQPPLSANLPSLGNNWGPRFSLAIGNAHEHWPVLRLGYGIYYGRTENATIETALTQTGSLKGDLSFFMRPSDDCQHCSGGAPPFPYVLVGQPTSLVAPGAVGFASKFHNPEVHQAIASIEQPLPGHVMLTAGAMLSLGRRLPISIDTNFNPAVNPGAITYSVKDSTGTGPIKSAQITVPFYASWPFAECPAGSPLNPASQCGRRFADYQQIARITSRANSTYETAMVKIARYGRNGLSFHANYTYAHAMDWNPNETTLVAGSDVLDPANFSQEYGTGNFDVRHSASIMAIYEAPWKLRDFAGRIGNGWMLSGIGQFRSGLPYTMRTSGSLPEEFDTTGNAITGLGPGMNGSGGDNRVYGLGNDGRTYNIGRNTFRYPNTWKADLRLAKRFNIGERRQLELIAETFNLFNHQNVTGLETTGYSIENSGSSGILPTLCYLTINTVGSASCGTTTITGSGTPIAAFGRPLNINATDFYRERQIEIGLRMRF